MVFGKTDNYGVGGEVFTGCQMVILLMATPEVPPVMINKSLKVNKNTKY